MFNSFKSNSIFKYVFLQHPEEQNMTYLEHLKHACYYGIQALGCSIIFMVHGFVPCLFEKTGSVMLEQLNEQLHGNNMKKDSDKEKIN